MIHQTAIVDEKASIAEDVSIGPYSIIGAGVEIDSGTWVGPHVVINGPTKIGKNNKIFQFASVGEEPQDLKFSGETSYLEIGDNNIIRENVTISRGTDDGCSITRIGDHNLLMAYVHVAHDCQIGNHIIFANSASCAGHVEVGDHAILGGFTLVHQFTKIGSRAFTSMGSIINQDVPPYVIVASSYGKASGINKVGLKRSGCSDEVIRAIVNGYKLMVRSKKPRNQAMEEASELINQYPEVKLMADFICQSERGIIR
ncbi:MAG: acyl-[acyl-carrier-protein]--UDP-N-acetylglucosamine O-acyltransferase [endosymbiont of Galathealinum brachiosum]|uniref:Acyl-[acyl-carrier-protein]--UDP-N-acetylglucosamine O-acyltransferase n=1 Tax=endosymbiont of Galathealinum brachiosum TaxID=2200906 RepID=A0A370DK37_9GAMM|nr:MAG: acyl-[acyl-carrier-protein]--UDP-N-acetylglucosamine O-acyltransferase [endosymbiont of Galathealinum brachiosum]